MVGDRELSWEDGCAELGRCRYCKQEIPHSVPRIKLDFDDPVVLMESDKGGVVLYVSGGRGRVMRLEMTHVQAINLARRLWPV